MPDIDISPVQLSDEISQGLHSGQRGERLSAIKTLFASNFEGDYTAMARAGGRVNLIGEHVDYPQRQFNYDEPAHLYSMGGAVSEEYLVLVQTNDKGKIQIIHADAAEQMTIEAADLFAWEQTAKEERDARLPMAERSIPAWAFHSLGCLIEASNRDVKLEGIVIILSSNVPHGAGMSNSAANCVALGKALDAVYDGLGVDDGVALADFARESENGHFAGGHCGFLDQLLIVFSEKDALTAIDYADKKIEHFESKLPNDWQFVAYNTNVPHVLAESEYNDRVNELEVAMVILSKSLGTKVGSPTLHLAAIETLIGIFDPTVPKLELPAFLRQADTGRELSQGSIDQIKAYVDKNYYKPELPRHRDLNEHQSFALLLRRMRHQKVSSLIVPQAGEAARSGDVQAFGELLTLEGKSLRMSGDFQITGDNGAQDQLLDAGFAAAHELGLAIYGRMLGGGGGGNVLFFVDRANEATYTSWKTNTAEAYNTWTKQSFEAPVEATVIEPVISEGASLV